MQVLVRSLFVLRPRSPRPATSATDTVGVAHHAVMGLLADERLVQAFLELLRLLVLLMEVLRPGLHLVRVLSKHVELIRTEVVILLELLPVTTDKHLAESGLELLSLLLSLGLVEVRKDRRVLFLLRFLDCLLPVCLVRGLRLCGYQLVRGELRLLRLLPRLLEFRLHTLVLGRIDLRRTLLFGALRSRSIKGGAIVRLVYVLRVHSV